MEDGESRKGPCVDTVRALHQTVIALRKALEESKQEILDLKSKSWSSEVCEGSIKILSLENHVLRQKIIEQNESEQKESKSDAVKKVVKNHEKYDTLKSEKAIETNLEPPIKKLEAKNNKKLQEVENKCPTTLLQVNFDEYKPRGNTLKTSVKVESKLINKSNVTQSLESLTIVKTPFKKVTFSKSTSFYNLTSLITCEVAGKHLDTMEDKDLQNANNNKFTESNEVYEIENAEQDQEVDDIELIFTTDDTKDQEFKEGLVSIDIDGSNLLACPDLEHSFDVSDRELDDDVFNEFENENQETTFQREDSQIYNSKSDNSINHEERSFKSYYSYQDSSFENRSLEKDESFDRFEEKIRVVETDISKCGIQDVEYVGTRRNTCPNPLQYRPLLHREALTRGLNVKKGRPILAHSNAVRKESGAQTDISAIPGSSWRSESSLGNPKVRFEDTATTLPSKYTLPGPRLRPSEKTVEARRILLSDIGFTSMVPELSRSADYLCPGGLQPPVVTSYGQFLKTSDLYSPAYTSQKFIWTATNATPSEGSRSHSRYSSVYPVSPPAPSRRCSAPVSPSRRATMKSLPSRVRFANASLPELRDWTTALDSGDSTDSLVDEAESYLRRSIDCIVSGRGFSSYGDIKKPVLRRASAPEPSCDNVPPQGWQPFLPRVSRDLKPDHWVKVITAEGRVRGGRVRYVGSVVSQTEHFVGVQLSTPEGYTDGTYVSRTYFQCEPYHGIFVPFKKVIMGWRP